MNNITKYALTLLCAAMLSACSGPAEEDNIESFNRSVFAFNEAVDSFLLEPVARGYRFVTPDPIIVRLRNASRNLNEPVTMLNAFLQGDVEHGFSAFWRFMLNSTVGLAGLHDVASDAGLAHHPEDFGQTLAVWGVGEGDYVVLPIFGPSTARDAFGLLVDIASSPFTYYPEDNAAAIAIGASQGLIRREALLDPIEDVYETSFDPYVSFRSIYLQRRAAEIGNRRSVDAVSGM